MSKMKHPLPEQWQKNQDAAKATQVAFDLDEKFQYSIRKAALDAGVSPSDQIRTILGLSVSKRPTRPRLTVSLNADDYVQLNVEYSKISCALSQRTNNFSVNPAQKSASNGLTGLTRAIYHKVNLLIA